MAGKESRRVPLDPRDPRFRRKLWVRVQTAEGIRLVVFWPRLAKVAAGLVVAAWLAVGTAAWAFVRHGRGVETVRWVDVVTYPVNRVPYRATLGRHHLAAGRAHLEQQRWREGLMSVRAALAYDPRSREARAILADYHLAIRQPAQALQLLEEGLPSAGEGAAEVEDYLKLCLENGEPARALRAATAWLPSAPDAVPAHRRIALRAAEALLQMRRGEEGVALLLRWRLDDEEVGQLFLAAAEHERGDTTAAAARLEPILERDPANERVAIRLTHLYRGRGRLEAARRVALLRRLARPDSLGAQVDLLNLDWELGRRDDFARGADAFLATFAADPRALQLLAQTAVDHADAGLAGRIVAAARQSGHGLPPFLLALMQAQCRAGRHAAALATAGEIDRGAELAPGPAAILRALKAWAAFGAGDQAAGEVWLHRFVAEPDLPEGPMLALAEGLTSIQPDAAVRVLQAAVDRPAAGEAPLRRLAQLLVTRQDWPAARRLLPRLKTLPEPPADLIGTIESNLALLGL